MAYLAENITTAGAKAGVSVVCPCALKFIGRVAPTSIELSATDADYVPVANVDSETVKLVNLYGTFNLRAVVNHVDDETDFDIEILELN